MPGGGVGDGPGSLAEPPQAIIVSSAKATAPRSKRATDTPYTGFVSKVFEMADLCDKQANFDTNHVTTDEPVRGFVSKVLAMAYFCDTSFTFDTNASFDTKPRIPYSNWSHPSSSNPVFPEFILHDGSQVCLIHSRHGCQPTPSRPRSGTASSGAGICHWAVARSSGLTGSTRENPYDFRVIFINSNSERRFVVKLFELLVWVRSCRNESSHHFHIASFNRDA